ncbi:MAG: phosphohistidine phosphatase [Patiriisocius sp.]|jgi:phosphohistidine phosphatase
MKTLYLTRHAKSSWKHDVIDHQRPLKIRGEKDAALVSKEVTKTMLAPAKIISSDAVRAFATANYFKDAFDISDSDFSVDHELYDFSGQKVIKAIKNLDDSLDCVLFFGHNHAFTSIVNMLGNKYIDNLPTAGFVAIQFDTNSWSAITVGETIKTIFPRDLK